ncbi:MAG TPA: peptidase S41, partial [Thermoanaerobaculia bacterium]
TIPTARALNPITKTNWEGTGVKPDIEVPAAEALHTAHTLALEKLAARGKPLERIEPSRNRPARVQG